MKKSGIAKIVAVPDDEGKTPRSHRVRIHGLSSRSRHQYSSKTKREDNQQQDQLTYLSHLAKTLPSQVRLERPWPGRTNRTRQQHEGTLPSATCSPHLSSARQPQPCPSRRLRGQDPLALREQLAFHWPEGH